MKSKLICTVLAFTMAFSTVAFANTSADKTYDRANNTIVVEGTTDKDGYARMLVLKPGTNIADMTDSQIWAQTVYADEVSITSRAFTFDTFSINPLTNGSPTPEGTYIIRIMCGNEAKTITVDYASVDRTIELLCSAPDAASLSSYIDKYNDVYEFEVGTGSKYASFSTKGKTWVLGSICDDPSADDGLDAAQKAFTQYSSLWRVHAEPWASVRDVIDNYSSDIDLSLTKYNLLINEDERDLLANKLSGTLYDSIDDFQEAVDKTAESIVENRNKGGNDNSNRDDNDGFNININVNRDPVSTEKEPVVNFDDIKNHWAEDSILLLAKKGIVNGKDGNNFEPEAYVTRAEAIKMLVLAFGELDANAVTDFSDVSANSWMYPYIATAASNGILNGYEDGTVGANNTVTRQDLCVMILRTARAFNIPLENSGSEHSFADADGIADYAEEAVTTLWNNNIISGFEDGTFGPGLGTTRAQISKMIAGFLK